ncbi:MAG: hypothetical protein ACOH1R_09545 [Luteimonas sp.]
MRTGTVAGQVGDDQLDALQVRGQWNETGGVVEPAMQGEHARRAGFAATQAGDVAGRNFQGEFAHHCQASRITAKS